MCLVKRNRVITWVMLSMNTYISWCALQTLQGCQSFMSAVRAEALVVVCVFCLVSHHGKSLWKLSVPKIPSNRYCLSLSAYNQPQSPTILCCLFTSDWPVTLLCSPGASCEECAPGYYGNPSQPGGRCQPCRCNNNLDLSDPASCDQRTGECRKCLYNTEGPDCGVCKSGYYGDASRRNCRSK